MRNFGDGFNSALLKQTISMGLRQFTTSIASGKQTPVIQFQITGVYPDLF